MRRVGRLLSGLTLVTAGALLGAGGWWALSEVYLPPSDEAREPPPPTAEVTHGTVGRSLNLAAEAERERAPLPSTMASGRITALPAEPRALDSGEVAFEVDLRPIVVAEGDTPASRDLKPGTTGPDVVQLQRLLGDLGHDLQADGAYGPRTEQAVRDWQEDLGVDRTGEVLARDILFVSGLPVTVVPAEERDIGDLVSPGDVVVDQVSSTPRFTIQISQDQTDLVPLDAEVVVDPSEAAWQARIAERIAGTGAEEGAIDLVLEGDEGPVCPAPCDAVEGTGETEVFPSEVTVVPETEGPVVPVSALRAGLDGSAVVATADGEDVPVRVVAQANGRAVVEGVDVGEVVRLFGEQASAQGGDAS